MNLNLLKKQVISSLDSKGVYFLSNLLRLAVIKKVDKDTIAYVRPDDNNIVIYIGNQFEGLSYYEKQGVILHEILHIPQIKELPCFMFDYLKIEAQLEGDTLSKFKDRESDFFKSVDNKLKNLGLDADVNTTVEQLGFRIPKQCVSPENLNDFVGTQTPPPKRGSDFATFIQYCIDEIDVPPQPESNKGEGEGENLDPSDWGELLDAAIEEATSKAVEQAKKGNQNEIDAKICGHVSGKNLMKVKPLRVVPQVFVKDLERVRRKLKAIRGEKEVFSYSWSRRHKAFPSKVLPQLRQEKFIKRTEKVVVVMDSSGSAWSSKNFELGVTIVEWFERQNLLGGFWCCDTELIKVEKDKRNFRDVKGGGGTEFDKWHVEQIVKDVGEDISILYLTDGELDLRDANERKDTHVLVCF